MSMRIFTLTNPKQPVVAVCDLCGLEIKTRRQSNAAGEQWVNGEELVQAWIDHQLDDCKEGGEDESILRR